METTATTKDNGTTKNIGAFTLRTVRKFFPQVTSVKDATSSLIIEVTPEDAKRSKRKDLNSCAMAVACKRSLKLDGIVVSRRTALLIKGRKVTRYVFPDSVTREIVSFDRGAGFEPGIYRLAKPRSSQKLGSHRRDQGGNVREKKNVERFRHRTTGIRAVLGQDS